ncbi:hypothetical protein LCGC14_1377880 [marine sediment metagenome]|uniref:Uncharacterized protein n=1 Tax=marine sediment metagenome TaxID=412755 RepID=A0A0F9K3J4_9ZZZZ
MTNDTTTHKNREPIVYTCQLTGCSLLATTHTANGHHFCDLHTDLHERLKTLRAAPKGNLEVRILPSTGTRIALTTEEKLTFARLGLDGQDAASRMTREILSPIFCEIEEMKGIRKYLQAVKKRLEREGIQ